jgi:hypothetical protein
MNMDTKTNIFEEHLESWLEARKDKKKRGEIIRHICFVIGAHPKSIPRSFKRIQLRGPGTREARGRKRYYTSDCIAALKEIWRIASEPCGDNLHSLIADYVKILRRDEAWPHSEESTGKLLQMSLGTVKIRVAEFDRECFFEHGKGTTQKGAIHAQIPIRTGPWDEAPTGTEQIDTVAHCGSSVAGDFTYTLNSTDIPTLWGERRAQWNKGKYATIMSLEKMENDTPFPILERHPDSGSEFVNWFCKSWSDSRGQKLTRSRPNHKNDNCFVEERNGHVVRRWVRYSRLDARQVVGALNAVYDVLNPYLNHFIASRRIVSKERIGSKWKITREAKAMTPYQRVLLRDDVSDEVKTKLRQEHEKLSPLVLKLEIDLRLERVFDIQKRYGIPMQNRELR